MADRSLQQKFAEYKKKKGGKAPPEKKKRERSELFKKVEAGVSGKKKGFVTSMFGKKKPKEKEEPKPEAAPKKEPVKRPELPKSEMKAEPKTGGIFSRWRKRITEKHKFEKLRSDVENTAKKKEHLRKDVEVTSFRVKRKKRKKIALSAAEKRRRLKSYLEQAGYDVNEQRVYRNLFHITIFLSFALSAFFLYKVAGIEQPLIYTIVIVLLLWSFGFLVLLMVTWIFFYIFIDFKIIKRRLELEAVLPDFLQLTSSNIRAGMPIDRALWFAVRPRFGVLAKEIEEVAKQTLSGMELKDALLSFTKRYDSTVLKRSISLLVEGLEAGGEIGDLLNKISLDIQETRIMKKEMAANVTTYVIFITFASVIAAPFLFGLSYTLLSIIHSIMGSIDPATTATGGGGLGFNLSGDSVKLADFKVFAMVVLSITSFFSAAISSTIKKGNIIEGIKSIPIYIIITLTLFWVARKILGSMMLGLIAT